MPLSKAVEDVGDSLPKHGVPEFIRHSREMEEQREVDSGIKAQRCR